MKHDLEDLRIEEVGDITVRVSCKGRTRGRIIRCMPVACGQLSVRHVWRRRSVTFKCSAAPFDHLVTCFRGRRNVKTIGDKCLIRRLRSLDSLESHQVIGGVMMVVT